MISPLSDISLSFGQGIVAESGAWYNTLNQLGRGGNSTTYLMVGGSKQHQGNLFAVKLFVNIDRPERRESFLREVHFLRKCDHPGILRIYDEGTYRDDYPFVVMEYLPLTLKEVIRANRASVVEKTSYATQLLSTLAYLDSQSPSILHRDIKPQNIFIKGQSCVLGDFGLLKRLDQTSEDDPSRVFKESVGPGMPFFYRTPDLVDYVKGLSFPTTKSDLFQLGLVLTELFTGRNPQLRAENGDFLSEIRLEQIGFIPGLTHSVIRNLLYKMLEIDPVQRISIDESRKAWQQLLMYQAKQMNAIEGKVFLA